MQFLEDFSLKAKISSVLLIPMLALLWFSTVALGDGYEFLNNMKRVNNLSQLAVKISLMLNEIQQERDMSVGFLGSSGKNFAKELPQQQSENSDHQIDVLLQFIQSLPNAKYDAGLRSAISDAMEEIVEIRSIRQQVENHSIKIGGVVAIYGKISRLFLKSIERIFISTESSELASLATAYSSFLMLKDYAGVERAVLTNSFARDGFGKGMFRKFNSLVTEQNSFKKKFLTYAPPDLRIFSKNVLSDPIIDKFKQMRKTAVYKGLNGGFAIDPNRWYEVATIRIDLLKEIEERISENILTLADDMQASAKEKLLFYRFLNIVSGVLSSVFIFIVFKSVMARGKEDEPNDYLSGLEELTEALDSAEEQPAHPSETFDYRALITNFVEDSFAPVEGGEELKYSHDLVENAIRQGHYFFQINLALAGGPTARKMEFDKVKQMVESVGQVVLSDPLQPGSVGNFTNGQQRLFFSTVLEQDLLSPILSLPSSALTSVPVPSSMSIAFDRPNS
ncbi:MAG: nitrate- and nitrite sensing domain-containing protein [Magnetococcales bacterium]|nr:nitrate- and nitrite sensing domain-containing protein [Magnetococcales bacterium]